MKRTWIAAECITGRLPRLRALPLLLGALPAVLLVALLALAACSEPESQWTRRGQTCVMQLEGDGPVRRIVNRTDPELCGRSLKHRPAVYLRVQPPPGTSSR